jgi:hypothetical protein
MQPKLTLLTFALFTLVVAAAACDATPAESFRDFDTGTGGESGSDTGGLDIICVSDEDGVTAEREHGEGCPMDYTLGCVASEYPDPTAGAACCRLLEESDCFMNWGESTCPTGFARPCSAPALGDGQRVCGTSDSTHMFLSPADEPCHPRTHHVCYPGEFHENGSLSVCCGFGSNDCNVVDYGASCIATQWKACDRA